MGNHKLRAGLAALAVGTLGFAGIALTAGAANATTNVTGTTWLPDNGDNGNGTGNGGTWADDAFHRVLTVTDSNACSPAPLNGYNCYAATVSDSGTFKTIPGNGNAPNPNSTTDVSNNIAWPPVSGKFTGSGTYLFEANAAPAVALIANTQNNSGVYQSGATNKNSTSGWFRQAFGSTTTFLNSNGTSFTGALQNDWGWNYTTYTGASPSTTAVACETWADTAANGAGNTALDGNITGKQCPGAPITVDFTGAISNAYSHLCLDNSGFRWTAGNLIQQWSCGAAGGVDQRFQLHWTGSVWELRAIDFSHPSDLTAWCVTTDGISAHQLTLQVCTGATGQQVLKQGSYYKFPGTAMVMDDGGWSRANGGKVIGYPQKAYSAGANQHWSMP